MKESRGHVPDHFKSPSVAFYLRPVVQQHGCLGHRSDQTNPETRRSHEKTETVSVSIFLILVVFEFAGNTGGGGGGFHFSSLQYFKALFHANNQISEPTTAVQGLRHEEGVSSFKPHY